MWKSLLLAPSSCRLHKTQRKGPLCFYIRNIAHFPITLLISNTSNSNLHSTYILFASQPLSITLHSPIDMVAWRDFQWMLQILLPDMEVPRTFLNDALVGWLFHPHTHLFVPRPGI